ncbi:MAG TPA: efflux RND transporter permease subunit [Microlunatus sp.]
MTAFFGGVIRLRLLILAAALGILAVGIVQLRGTPVDVLPEFTPPYAEIQTEALGLSAEEVEQLITVPLEADLLNGVQGVAVIRSESVPGLSSIVLVFEPGSDVYQARQLVQERLTQAHALPNVSKPPTLLQPLSSSNRVLMIGLSSTELTPIEQSVIARWTVRPRLMGVSGVANISVWGMRDQQLQVQVDPERLRDRKVTLSQVINTAGNAQVASPLTFLEASTPGTGGFIETPQQRLQVRHLLEKIADPAELSRVPVEGADLQLGDVADIKVDHQPLIGDAVVGGGPGLILVVEKFPGISTPEVTADVEEALETLRPGLTGIATDTTLFRPSDYVQEALDNAGLAVLVGGILLLVGLLAVWLRWRAVAVAVVTVPVALATAGVVMQLLGQGLNALVFAGTAAATAIVVDEAVVFTDRVMRRLVVPTPARTGPVGTPPNGTAAGSRRDVSAVIVQASVEARRPLVYATLVALLAVVPVAVLEGRPGAFFSPLVTAYAVALAAAMLVALTVAPALTHVLFATRVPASDPGPTRLQRLASRYETGLQWFSRRPKPAVLAAAGLALVGIGAAAVVPLMGTAVLPTFADRNVLVRLQGQSGASNQWMTAKTTEVGSLLSAVPGVATVGGQVGRAVTGDRVVNVSSSDLWVTVASDADYDETLDAIDAAVKEVADVTAEVSTYTTQKMRDVGALTGTGGAVQTSGLDVLTGLNTPLAVRLFGQDPVVLTVQAERIKALMSGVDGLVSPQIREQPLQPTIEIEVDLEKAQHLGVSPGLVRRAEATLLQGIQVGSVFEQQKVFDVVVQGAPQTRRSMEDVRNLLIDRPGGGHFRLGDVADVRTVQTAAVIHRDAVSRRLDIVAAVEGRSVSEVAADLEQRLAGQDLPLEYHAEVLQKSTAEEVNVRGAVGFAIAAALAAFLLFQAAFQSWRLAAITFLSLPLTLVGGLIAALITEQQLSLGALLGLLSVFGLAARMSTMLISSLQSAPDVLGGAREQFAPVLTSTVAIGLLALPFVVMGSRPGLEIVHPMAVVLLGGLLTTALVTLFVLPSIYRHAAGLHPGKRSMDEPEPHPGTGSAA